MSIKKVVIIGGGIAGRNVVRELLRKNYPGEIYLIRKETHPSYSPCGIPFVISGEIPSMEDILFPNLDNRFKNKGVNILSGAVVEKIDLEGKNIRTEKDRLHYDILVIATGRKPNIPPIPGRDLKEVYTLINYEDGLKLYEKLEGVKKATIIGGGFIGMEVAAAFIKRGILTTVVEIKENILPDLVDSDVADIVKKNLTEKGAKIITGCGVSRINGTNKVESVSVNGNSLEIDTDLVLISTGVKPEVEIARKAGIEIGKFGGIVTDTKQHVKTGNKFLSNVYALGDCVQIKNKITGMHGLSPLVEAAIIQAKVIADDISSTKVNLDGFLSSGITIIGDLQVGSVGLTSKVAKEAGISPKIIKASGYSKEAYFPSNEIVDLKLLIYEDCLIGAQVVSKNDIKGILDYITVLIAQKIELKTIYYHARSYTPGLSSSPDVFRRALEELF
ncbi:MAG: FAD-dependent oxidoreductase [Elusimicrobiota bacterium]